MVSKETKLLKQMLPIYYDVIKKTISSQDIYDVIFPFQVLIRMIKASFKTVLMLV